MKLYIGGAYQGQNELAAFENPDAEIITDFHETVRRLLKDGVNAADYAREICAEKPDAVICANEIGSGIVPVDPEERRWREAAGRALCVIAQNAGEVVRVVCGIGCRIK